MIEKGCTETRSGYQHNRPLYVIFLLLFSWLGFFRITTKAHLKKENLIIAILITKSVKTHKEYC